MENSTPPTRGRGRPRSERARQAIVQAAGELLAEGGMPAATMEAIAARAGVSKATIYKWWPSRGAVMLEGLFELTRSTLDVPEGADLRAALKAHIGALEALLVDGVAGPLLRALLAEAGSDPAVAEALRERWLGPRRAIVAERLRAAIARGELRADTDIETAGDQLFAPVYYRLLFGHAPLDDALAGQLVDQLLDGLLA